MTTGDAVGTSQETQHDLAAQQDSSSTAPVHAATAPVPFHATPSASRGPHGQFLFPRRGNTEGGQTGLVHVEELPIHKHRDKILENINNNFITCIQGETGCGKSTQVPKFLLDQDAQAQQAIAAIRAGKKPPPATIPLPSLDNYRPLKCIVTQPRRLACISLAQRVAHELGEDTGGVAGYRISGESKTSKRTKVFFMTTGYLLQILVNTQAALPHMLTEEELNLEASGKPTVLQQRTGATIAAETRQSESEQQPEGALEGYLDDVTHIILDEVHERSVDADLLSLVLKLQLRSRIGRLKVVVMSATMQGNLFFNYFSDVHLRNVPGEHSFSARPEHGEEQPKGDHHPGKIFVGAKRFPVHILYLDDLSVETRETKALRPVSETELSGTGLLMEGKDEEEESEDEEPTGGDGTTVQYKLRQSRLDDVDIMTALLKRRGKELEDLKASMSLKLALEDFRGAADGVNRKRSSATDTSSAVKPEIKAGLQNVCFNLVSLLGYGGETILIFLPGIAEISSLFELLADLERRTEAQNSNSSNDENAPSKETEDRAPTPTSPVFKLFVLHSTISREEQTEVFSPPPADTCHVVLASNIAESSLTLPKCRVVIDFCLRRQMIYDHRRHASALVKTWTSHASSQQRSGRTGRVFPGVCIRMVDHTFYKNCMQVFDLPEMQTAPLDKLYITAAHLTKRLNTIAQAADRSLSFQHLLGRRGRPTSKPANFHECLKAGCLTPSQLLLLTVQPPSPVALAAAQAGLKEQGALDSNGELTRLGYMMMQLPIDCRLCKLLFLGIVFGYTLDAVVLASCLATTDLFAFPSLALLQRHSKAAAGLDAALQLQQQLKSRAIFDGGHLSEPLMLRNCFVEFLINFAASTAEVRARLARQAGPSRSKRLELNMKLQYNQVAREFGRVHAVLPRRLVQATLLCCDLSQRLCTLLDKSSTAYKSLRFLLTFLQDGTIFPPNVQQPAGGRAAPRLQQEQQEQQQQQQCDAAEVPDCRSGVSDDPKEAVAAVQSRFMADSLGLKALMVAAFSPSFMVGNLKRSMDGEELVDVPDEDDDEGGNAKRYWKGISNTEAGSFSWLSFRGIDLSRCLFFNRSSNSGRLSQLFTALAYLLPGVDYAMLTAEDCLSCFMRVRASSAAAAEDPAVISVSTNRMPIYIQGEVIVYFPPTPRNECFHFDHKTAAAAALMYQKQLRTPPTGDAILEQQKQRNQRMEEREMEFLECRDDQRRAEIEQVGVVEISPSSVYDAASLKQINDCIAKPEAIRGNHIEPCKLFSSHPVCAQLINQFGCGRWKFNFPLPCTGNNTFSYELMRPKSPFEVFWYFLASQDTNQGSEDDASIQSWKCSKVQGILSYRSPMGALGVCPEVLTDSVLGTRTYKKPTEIYAVALAQQNKESSSQAWAEGVTILPQREALLLMLTFLPSSSNLKLCLQASRDEPVAITTVLLDGVTRIRVEKDICITLADLLRANVVRHLLSKALQEETEGAAQPLPSKTGARPKLAPALLGDNDGNLRAALRALLTHCNDPVSFNEVDELVHLAGGTPDRMLHVLFSKRLSFPDVKLRNRNNKQKSSGPLEHLFKGFVDSEEDSACLRPFDLRKMAIYYNNVIETARKTLARSNPKPPPLEAFRGGRQAGRARGRGFATGGSQHFSRTAEEKAHMETLYRLHDQQQRQQQQHRGSNRGRGRGGRPFPSAGGGGRRQRQQRGGPMAGMHQQLDQFNSGYRPANVTQAATSFNNTNIREKPENIRGAFSKRFGYHSQAFSASDAPKSHAAPAAIPHHPTSRTDHIQTRIETGLAPNMTAYSQQHAPPQHRYAAAAPSGLQQQQPQHFQYRQPQQMPPLQQHAYPPHDAYVVQQPNIQQSFMDASRFARQQHLPFNAAREPSLQQIQQQLQQLNLGTGAVPQQSHLQQGAHRGPM